MGDSSYGRYLRDLLPTRESALQTSMLRVIA